MLDDTHASAVPNDDGHRRVARFTGNGEEKKE
jgi:hypothetical protein